MYHKRSTIFVTVIIIFTNLFEVAAITLALPFFTFLGDIDAYIDNDYYIMLKSMFGIESDTNTVFAITGLFLFIIFSSQFLKLYQIFKLNKYVFTVAKNINQRIITNIAFQKYSYHFNRNSSFIVDALTNKSSITTFGIIMPIMNILSSFILTFALFIALLVINPVLTLSLFLILIASYSVIAFITKTGTETLSETIATHTTGIIRVLQEMHASLREIIIDKSQSSFIDNFSLYDQRLKDAQTKDYVIRSAPKILLEFIVWLLTAIVVVSSIINESLAQVIPFLFLVAITVLRVLPNMQTIFFNYQSIKASASSLDDINYFLELKKERTISSKNIQFNNNIELRNINFSYEDNNVLTNLSLEIIKSKKIAIVGETGSGKSTLIDIILGLIEPYSGLLLIDGKEMDGSNYSEWHNIVSHVPQNVTLLDSDIKTNITLSSPNEIDYLKLDLCIRVSELDVFIRSLDSGIDSMVGEGGGRLSGGQKQRMGIARALYKSSNVIVMDEATSALDESTQNKIFSNINEHFPEITIICITHSNELLRHFDEVYKIQKGVILKSN